ncbi:hypothetical protein JHK82_047967 [Glycine max]|nr:hypothetical protein JHK82_047967 [Glycine max]
MRMKSIWRRSIARSTSCNKYKEEPFRRNTFTVVRKSHVGDIKLLHKVFLLLEHWGLINFDTAPPSSHADEEYMEEEYCKMCFDFNVKKPTCASITSPSCNMYREEPFRRHTFTEVRKSHMGDVAFLYKLFLFLEHWGFIKFDTTPPSSHADEEYMEEEYCKICFKEGAPSRFSF